MEKINFNSYQDLIDESIFIIREVHANASNPVFLFSIGKDSCVLLDLIRKAFYPGKCPFKLLHVDTGWKFKEMIKFRDHLVTKYNLDIIIYQNHDGKKLNLNPFTDGANQHTDLMKTQALKQVINKYKFDFLIGGARRDEEKSRAKERIMSFRNQQHQWDPKNQRPELWNLYNTYLNKGESFRAFPISNWTEIDIWTYIKNERIEVCDLYFAKNRQVFMHEGQIILADDNRVPKNSSIIEKKVRFRTLGCYPLSGAFYSDASTIEKLLDETINFETKERMGRVIDNDKKFSMENKKKHGYF